MKAEHRLICIHNFLFNHSAISRYDGTRNQNNGALYKAIDGKTNSIYVRASSTSFHVFDLDVLSNETTVWLLDLSEGKSELERVDDSFTVEDALSHDAINNVFPMVSSYPENWLKDLLGIADELVDFKKRYGFEYTSKSTDSGVQLSPRDLDIFNFVFGLSFIPDFAHDEKHNNLKHGAYKSQEEDVKYLFIRTSSEAYTCYTVVDKSCDITTIPADRRNGMIGVEVDGPFDLERVLMPVAITKSEISPVQMKDLFSIAEKILQFKTERLYASDDGDLNRDPDLNRAQNLPFISRTMNSGCFSVVNVSKDYLGSWADILPKRLGVIFDDSEVEGLRKSLWKGWCNCSRDSKVGIGYSTSLGNIYIWSLPSANKGKFSYEICLPNALTPMINTADLEAIVPTILGVKWEPLIELVSTSIRNKVWNSFLK